ncbi:YadA-like family protein [Mannheimia pernigra]|uniref:YadA-like family protein n=1 Tax=Mannheimia pernigra TaxID=111844 RepID=UPI001316E867|nr:YadA-like family protein [Mannheimia pernigra]QHB17291.1 hypothetical protein GM695_04220 [Mannheimia pernigra]
MNHIYKIVFNKVTGTMTAAAEFARGHGKGSLRTKIFRPVVFRLSLLVVALGLAGVAQAAVTLSPRGLSNGGYQITNVANGANTQTINTTINTTGTGTQAQSTLLDLSNNSQNSNAATVGDLKNLGFVVSAQDSYKDTVTNAQEVKFKGTNGVVVKGETKGNVREITIEVETAIDTNTVTGLIDSDTTTVVQDDTSTSDKPVYKVQVNKAGVNKTNTDVAEANNITLTNAGKVVAPTNDAQSQNRFVTAQTLTDVVNNTGFVATSGVEGTGQQLGAKANTLIKSGETVTYKAGDNLSVKQEGANFTFATKENVKFTTVTTGNTVMDNTGISINNDAAGKVVKLTKDGLDNGGNTINNVKAGVNETDAVNVAQLKKAMGGATTQIAQGKNVIVKNEKGVDGQAVYTVHADSSKVTQGDGIVVTPTQERDENGVKTNSYKVALSEATKTQLQKEESVTSQDNNLLVDNTTTNDTGAKEYKLTLNKKIDLTAEGSLTIGDSKLDKEGLTIKGGPTVKKSGIDAGSKKITNVEDGEIRAGSKDAVNGGQLQSELDNIGWDLTVAGNTAKDSEQGSKKVKNKGKVTVSGGKNMVVSRKDSTVEVATSSNPEFDTVKVGNTTISSSIAQDGVNEVKISGAKNAPTRITNVAPGLKGTDAVNVNQLNQVKNDIGNLSRKVDKIDRRVRGIGASAAASSALPQVYLPGKSMIAAAGGTYDGATAVSVGYSKASDNSKLILKLQGTATSEGNLSGGVGVGYQW